MSVPGFYRIDQIGTLDTPEPAFKYMTRMIRLRSSSVIQRGRKVHTELEINLPCVSSG